MDATFPNQSPNHSPSQGPDPRSAGVTQEWERTYAMWIHVGTLIGCALAVCSFGVAFWGPSLFVLLMWLGKRERSAFVDDHGREALNFTISLMIYCGATTVMAFITFGIALIFLVPAIVILTLVGLISGARHAARGKFYRYPMCLRFVG